MKETIYERNVPKPTRGEGTCRAAYTLHTPYTVTAKTNKQDRTGFAKMVIETDSNKPSVPAVNKSEYALFGK